MPYEKPTDATLPLSGIRVIDLANFLAGPITSMFLADFGADVIKVERPETGDEVRFWGNNKDGVGLMYKLINRNKRSITADLKSPVGAEIVKRLVKDADVVIENFRKGTLEKWGLGYDVLSEINPSLVMVRITGFGQTGPNSHRPGFGTLAEGYSGFAYINGFKDRPPLLPGFGMADDTAGLMGAYLTLVGIQRESVTAERAKLSTSAFTSRSSRFLDRRSSTMTNSVSFRKRNGSRLSFTAPRNTYRTKDDKWLSISDRHNRPLSECAKHWKFRTYPIDRNFSTIDCAFKMQKSWTTSYKRLSNNSIMRKSCAVSRRSVRLQPRPATMCGDFRRQAL